MQNASELIRREGWATWARVPNDLVLASYDQEVGVDTDTRMTLEVPMF